MKAINMKNADMAKMSLMGQSGAPELCEVQTFEDEEGEWRIMGFFTENRPE
jgi:hypothetical protein